MKYLHLFVIVQITILISMSVSYGQEFNVCEGEYETRCPPHEAYTYCGTIASWAANACKSAGMTGTPSVIELQSRGGNKCGYGLFRVICR